MIVRSMSANDRKAHLRELADEYGCHLDFRTGWGAYEGAYGEASSDDGKKKTVWCAWFGGNLSYLVGLHEIGHIACGHHDSHSAFVERYLRRIVEAEAEAWDWAFAQARERLSRRTRRRISEMLGSYVCDYGLTTAATTYSSVVSQIEAA